MCDLDFFKAFNDHFGHLAGDTALRLVADTMRAQLRAGDGVFRFGGEEFVVLLHEQGIGEARHAMERIRGAIERLAVPAPTGRGVLTLSIGVAALDLSRDKTAEEWLARADAALYSAKGDGRNRVAVA
jgi:diguanylate cyclase (GGDEF)-like protein